MESKINFKFSSFFDLKRLFFQHIDTHLKKKYENFYIIITFIISNDKILVAIFTIPYNKIYIN